MPYYIKDPKRDSNFDNHPHICLFCSFLYYTYMPMPYSAHANTTPLCGGFCACMYVCVKISQPFNHGLFTNKYMQIQKKRDTDTDTAREREKYLYYPGMIL